MLADPAILTAILTASWFVPCAGNNSNTERLLQRLHGSDGWEKLVSELQQKEEEEAQVQQPEVQAGPRAASRKRRRQGDNVAEKGSDR